MSPLGYECPTAALGCVCLKLYCNTNMALNGIRIWWHGNRSRACVEVWVADQQQDMNNFQLWKHALDNSDFVLCCAKYPFDMGWQQRGSAHHYNSQSGHALLIGGWTRKLIGFVVKSKQCNYCLLWRKKNQAAVQDVDDESFNSGLIPLHNCTINHKGSSGSMEPQACLEMVLSMFNKKNCVVNKICANDNTSIWSLLHLRSTFSPKKKWLGNYPKILSWVHNLRYASL